MPTYFFNSWTLTTVENEIDMLFPTPYGLLVIESWEVLKISGSIV